MPALVTPTVGTASRSVSLASAPRSVNRRTTEKPPATSSIASTISASRPALVAGCAGGSVFGAGSLAGSGLGCSVSSVINRFLSPGISLVLEFGLPRSSRLPASVNRAEDYRNKKQRSDRSKNQSADYRPSERCILLAALAHAQRHRHHADNHGQRRHNYWPHTRIASFQRRVPCRESLL